MADKSNLPMMAYAPALVLCLVAVTQRVLMETCSLDPWKGGGFGMFSAISAQSMRRMTITLVTADGQEKRFPPGAISSRIPLDGRMGRVRRNLITMPRTSAVRRLAKELAAAEWVVAQNPPTSLDEKAPSDEGGLIDSPSAGVSASQPAAPAEPREFYRMKGDEPEDAVTRPLALAAVNIEIWQYVFDRASQELKLTNLVTVSEPVP